LRVISRKRLRQYWQIHSDAETSLKSWYKVVEDAAWKTPKELTETINGVDPVKVSSGAVVSVFNIAHNKHRLIAHFHFDKQRAFVLRIMTHKEYDRGKWKEEL
jgi:mRNA interferase HigB